MKTIAVTGSLGYIGSHQVVKLFEQGYNVVGIDNLSNSVVKTHANIEKLVGKPFFSLPVTINYQNKFEIKNFLRKNQVDAIIHFAGYKSVPRSYDQPLSYYSNNMTSSLVMLEIAEDLNIQNFVFSSSATVYGPDAVSSITENSPARVANNPYGYTKIFTEQVMRDLSELHPEMKLTSLRYFNPVGCHPSGKIGELTHNSPTNLFPVIERIVSGRKDLLVIYGSDYPTADGSAVRDYIHVEDLVEGHISALNNAPVGYHEYNLGTNSGTSTLEIVDLYQSVNNIKIPNTIAGRRRGDIPVLYADATKAETELGWKTKRTLEDMVRDSYNWAVNGDK